MLRAASNHALKRVGMDIDQTWKHGAAREPLRDLQVFRSAGKANDFACLICHQRKPGLKSSVCIDQVREPRSLGRASHIYTIRIVFRISCALLLAAFSLLAQRTVV